MSTMQQKNKRETKQVRLSKKYHKELRIEAFNAGITMSSFLDLIIEFYFSNNEHSNRDSSR